MRHSKFLNSGLLAFLVENILVHEITTKKDSGKMRKYAQVINELNNVKAELDVVDALFNTICDKSYANKLLSEIKKDIKKIEKKKLDIERQKFYDNVVNIFPEIKLFLSTKINEYKTLASIKNFIDDTLEQKLNAKERLLIQESIISNLVNNKNLKYSEMLNEANSIPNEVDGLTLNIMLNDFMKRWKKILTETQYKYLIDYTSFGENINTKWKRKIIDNLEKHSQKIDDEELSNKIVAILERVNKNHNTENILEYCELVDALKVEEK